MFFFYKQIQYGNTLIPFVALCFQAWFNLFLFQTISWWNMHHFTISARPRIPARRKALQTF